MIDEKKLIEEIRNAINDGRFDEYKPAAVLYGVHDMITDMPKVDEWISIDDRLPTLGTWNIVTIKNHFMGGRKELRYPVIYMEKMYDVGYGFYENGTDILMPEYSEIIAWMPLPEPWEGENDV